MTFVLAVGAHPDDLELGCGGTLARHVAAGDTVMGLVLSSGVTSRIGSTPEQVAYNRQQADRAAQRIGYTVRLSTFPDQRFDEVAFIDIIRTIEATVKMVDPDVVYTHFAGDLNRDHVLTCRAVLTATRPGTCSVSRILAFEVPSSTEIGLAPFEPNYYVALERDHLAAKMDALRCYHHEMQSPPRSRSYDGVRTLARWRGAAVGASAAEGFVLVREIA